MKILKRFAEGVGSTAIGKEFGISESTIRGIRDRAYEIEAQEHSAKQASYARNKLIEKTEKSLLMWIKQLRQQQVPIDADLIKENALRFYNQLRNSASDPNERISKFTANNGWFYGFIHRHGLQYLKISTKKAAVEEIL